MLALLLGAIIADTAPGWGIIALLRMFISHHVVKANEVIRALDLCCLILLGPHLSLFLKKL